MVLLHDVMAHADLKGPGKNPACDCNNSQGRNGDAEY